MQIERLSTSQYKVFISEEELESKGIPPLDLNQDQHKWHDHFYELVEEACDSLGVHTIHHFAVELFTLHPYGVFLIITLLEEDEYEPWKDRRSCVYQFRSFEDIVQLAHRIPDSLPIKSALYSFDGDYFLLCLNENIGVYVNVYALVSEYGEESTITPLVLGEYGNCIFDEKAIEQIRKWFH